MLAVLIFSLNCYFDKYGVGFSDESLSKLITTPESLVEYTIPQKTITLAGGSERSSAFFPCRDKIKRIIFLQDSDLTTIEPYALSYLKVLEEINMSTCKKILKLSGFGLSSCYNLKAIILPPCLTYIGEGSLLGIGVSRLDFPSSLETIGGWTNYGSCIEGSNLSIITWGEKPSIKKITSHVFNYCSFSSLFIPSSLQILGSECFGGSDIRKIEVDPKNNYFSTDEHFLYNKDMTEIKFSPTPSTGQIILNEKVTSLGNGAFMSNKIDTVILSNNITLIGKDCFMYSAVKYITIPSSVVTIGNRTFLSCKSLHTVEFYANVKVIPSQMFNGCPKLKKISFTQGVETLGMYCLMNCKSMEYVFVPKTVSLIESGALTGINPDVFIDFENGSLLKFSQGHLYNQDYTIVTNYIGSSKEIYINSSVVTIGDYAFASLSIDNASFNGTSCTTIGPLSFACSTIQSIVVAGSVREILDSAFKDCKQLTSVTFNEGIETIYESAISGSSVSSTYFPKSILEIQQSAFASSSLSIVAFAHDCLLNTIGSEAFKGTLIETIQLPKYASSIGMNAFAGDSLKTLNFESPSSIGRLSDWSFAGCIGLTKINFVPGINSIGRSAFMECTSLQKLELGKDVVNVSMHSFKGCSELLAIKIPVGTKLQTIETLAFFECPKPTSFEISKDNKEFSTEDGVLYDYGKTQIVLYLPTHIRSSFTVPGTVSKLLIYSFQNAENLNSIQLPAGLTEIGFGAFSGCGSNIPLDITSIGNSAFEGCDSLGCGSIIYSAGQKQMLLGAGAKLSSLAPCPTGSFTVLPSVVKTADIAAPLLLSE